MRAFLVEIANTAHWGNKFRIAPRASVLDGALDVVIVDPLSYFDAPLFGARLRMGTIHRSRRVITHRVAEVVIRVAPAILPANARENRAGRIAGATRIHLDGEPLEIDRELRIRVRPCRCTCSCRATAW